MEKKFCFKTYCTISLWVLIWFGAVELPRYFFYVRPAMMEYLTAIPNMGRFGLFELLSWTFISVLLTCSYVFIFWLCAVAFGNNIKTVLLSGTFTWILIFGFYWVDSATMFTAEWKNLLVTLPLAYMETLGAAYISSKLYAKKGLC